MIIEQFRYHDHLYELSIDTSQGSTVPVSIHYIYDDYPNTPPPASATRIEWDMKLQRFYPTEGYSTIGTRSGYTTFNSNSNRSFTGVLKTNYPLRIVLRSTRFVTGSQRTTTSSTWYNN